MLYVPNGKNLALPIVLNSPLPGRFVGRIQYAPTRDNKKRKMNNEKAGYPAKFPGLGEALIFFSHPFLVSRQEKDGFPRKVTENEQRKSRVRAGRIQLRTRHFLRSVLGRYALSLSDVGDRNNIGKHTRCGHVGTGAVALDNHRILVITLGGDHNNVVAPLQFVERMGATNLL